MGPFADHPHTIEMVARLVDDELARKAALRASYGFAPPAAKRPGLRWIAARLRARREQRCEDCPPVTVGA